jgi:hypothetical protein
MRFRLALILAAAQVATLAAAPAAADSFRCGNRLVVEGTTRDQLLVWCGEPTDVQQSSILRPPIVWYYGRPMRVAGGDLVVQVERWTYNLGPNKFMRRVRLEDGEVVGIETLGYGYRGKAPAPPP